MWMRDTGVATGEDVIVELAPEGPQRGDLSDDIAAALEASPAAAAFFDTLAQFYRTAYLRWIDATIRRPDLRAARIAEVVVLLAATATVAAAVHHPDRPAGIDHWAAPARIQGYRASGRYLGWQAGVQNVRM